MLSPEEEARRRRMRQITRGFGTEQRRQRRRKRRDPLDLIKDFVQAYSLRVAPGQLLDDEGNVMPGPLTTLQMTHTEMAKVLKPWISRDTIHTFLEICQLPHWKACCRDEDAEIRPIGRRAKFLNYISQVEADRYPEAAAYLYVVLHTLDVSVPDVGQEALGVGDFLPSIYYEQPPLYLLNGMTGAWDHCALSISFMVYSMTMAILHPLTTYHLSRDESSVMGAEYANYRRSDFIGLIPRAASMVRRPPYHFRLGNIDNQSHVSDAFDLYIKAVAYALRDHLYIHHPADYRFPYHPGPLDDPNDRFSPQAIPSPFRYLLPPPTRGDGMNEYPVLMCYDQVVVYMRILMRLYLTKLYHYRYPIPFTAVHNMTYDKEFLNPLTERTYINLHMPWAALSTKFYLHNSLDDSLLFDTMRLISLESYIATRKYSDNYSHRITVFPSITNVHMGFLPPGWQGVKYELESNDRLYVNSLCGHLYEFFNEDEYTFTCYNMWAAAEYVVSRTPPLVYRSPGEPDHHKEVNIVRRGSGPRSLDAHFASVPDLGTWLRVLIDAFVPRLVNPAGPPNVDATAAAASSSSSSSGGGGGGVGAPALLDLFEVRGYDLGEGPTYGRCLGLLAYLHSRFERTLYERAKLKATKTVWGLGLDDQYVRRWVPDVASSSSSSGDRRPLSESEVNDNLTAVQALFFYDRSGTSASSSSSAIASSSSSPPPPPPSPVEFGDYAWKWGTRPAPTPPGSPSDAAADFTRRPTAPRRGRYARRKYKEPTHRFSFDARGPQASSAYQYMRKAKVKIEALRSEKERQASQGWETLMVAMSTFEFLDKVHSSITFEKVRYFEPVFRPASFDRPESYEAPIPDDDPDMEFYNLAQPVTPFEDLLDPIPEGIRQLLELRRQSHPPPKKRTPSRRSSLRVPPRTPPASPPPTTPPPSPTATVAATASPRTSPTLQHLLRAAFESVVGDNLDHLVDDAVDDGAAAGASAPSPAAPPAEGFLGASPTLRYILQATHENVGGDNLDYLFDDAADDGTAVGASDSPPAASSAAAAASSSAAAAAAPPGPNRQLFANMIPLIQQAFAGLGGLVAGPPPPGGFVEDEDDEEAAQALAQIASPLRPPTPSAAYYDDDDDDDGEEYYDDDTEIGDEDDDDEPHVAGLPISALVDDDDDEPHVAGLPISALVDDDTDDEDEE